MQQVQALFVEILKVPVCSIPVGGLGQQQLLQAHAFTLEFRLVIGEGAIQHHRRHGVKDDIEDVVALDLEPADGVIHG